MKSEFNESKAKCEGVLEKIEDDRHLWDSENGKLESNLAKIQTRLESMASERELLGQKNREISTEADSSRT